MHFCDIYGITNSATPLFTSTSQRIKIYACSPRPQHSCSIMPDRHDSLPPLVSRTGKFCYGVKTGEDSIPLSSDPLQEHS